MDALHKLKASQFKKTMEVGEGHLKLFPLNWSARL